MHTYDGDDIYLLPLVSHCTKLGAVSQNIPTQQQKTHVDLRGVPFELGIVPLRAGTTTSVLDCTSGRLEGHASSVYYLSI